MVTEVMVMVILNNFKRIRNCRVFKILKRVGSFPLNHPAAKFCHLYAWQTSLGAEPTMGHVTVRSQQLQGWKTFLGRHGQLLGGKPLLNTFT